LKFIALAFSVSRNINSIPVPKAGRKVLNPTKANKASNCMPNFALDLPPYAPSGREIQ
jgi:hypothetical protein